MKKILILIACLNLIVVVGPQKSATADSHQIHNQWHQWRGPDATGVAPHATPPTEWNENKNIRWILVFCYVLFSFSAGFVLNVSLLFE